VALDASVHLVCRTGRRLLPAGAFFAGDRPTALLPGELVDGVTVPVPQEGASWSFAEYARRGAFKFPLISVAVLRLPAGETKIVVGGGGGGPVVVETDDVRLRPPDLASLLALVDEPHAGRLFKARIARSLIEHCRRSTEATDTP
jgi:CO/xanthine dehydrogenase FAD-binding subunit